MEGEAGEPDFQFVITKKSRDKCDLALQRTAPVSSLAFLVAVK